MLVSKKDTKGGDKVNKNKFKGMLANRGENQKTLAEAMGMSRVTLSRKINESHNASFKLPEIEVIKARYRLTSTEVNDIFFAD